MKCPRCVQVVRSGEELCPHCGFTMAQQDGLFGSDRVFIEKLTDATHVLSDEDRTVIESTFVAFEKRFPQLFFSAYFGTVPAQSNLRQFGFWLLNRAAVSSTDHSRPNERGILLVVDVHGRAAALILGYFVECYLSEADVTTILHKAKANFALRNYGKAVTLVIGGLTQRLRIVARTAEKSASQFKPIPPSVGKRADTVDRQQKENASETKAVTHSLPVPPRPEKNLAKPKTSSTPTRPATSKKPKKKRIGRKR